MQIKDGVASQISNGHLKGSVATISLRRSDLDEITLGAASFQSKLGDGSIVVDGDVDRFVGFLQAHDQPDRWFNIVTP